MADTSYMWQGITRGIADPLLDELDRRLQMQETFAVEGRREARRKMIRAEGIEDAEEIRLDREARFKEGVSRVGAGDKRIDVTGLGSQGFAGIKAAQGILPEPVDPLSDLEQEVDRMTLEAKKAEFEHPTPKKPKQPKPSDVRATAKRINDVKRNINALKDKQAQSREGVLTDKEGNKIKFNEEDYRDLQAFREELKKLEALEGDDDSFDVDDEDLTDSGKKTKSGEIIWLTKDGQEVVAD